MPTYTVRVTIENKPGISDPEGETILRDLVLKGGGRAVTGVRAAKTLKFTVRDKDPGSARARISKICEDLRIYNPLVSRVTFGVSKAGSN